MIIKHILLGMLHLPGQVAQAKTNNCLRLVCVGLRLIKKYLYHKQRVQLLITSTLLEIVHK